MDTALVIEALNRALGHRQVETVQLLLHTDQGSQHRATDYRDLLKEQADRLQHVRQGLLLG